MKHRLWLSFVAFGVAGVFVTPGLNQTGSGGDGGEVQTPITETAAGSAPANTSGAGLAVEADSHAVSVATNVLASIRDMEAAMLSGHGPTPQPDISSAPKSPAWAKLPKLDPQGEPASNLRKAVRWFESLPKGQPPTRQQFDSDRARMAKAGLGLINKECRQGICRLSFTYLNWGSRSAPKVSSQIWSEAWSFTTVGPDGNPQGHIFIENRDQER